MEVISNPECLTRYLPLGKSCKDLFFIKQKPLVIVIGESVILVDRKLFYM